MRQRIDVADRFQRLDDPPVKQPPDYTDYPSGDVSTKVIPQEGLMDRKADVVSIIPVVVKPISIKPTVRIDIAKSFERVDDPPVRKPPDYTDYSSGDVKTKVMGFAKRLISQEGLHKRTVDVMGMVSDRKEEKWRSGLVEKDLKGKPIEIKPVKVQPGIYVKPVKNFGVLAYVDKFFNWLNKMLGE